MKSSNEDSKGIFAMNDAMLIETKVDFDLGRIRKKETSRPLQACEAHSQESVTISLTGGLLKKLLGLDCATILY